MRRRRGVATAVAAVSVGTLAVPAASSASVVDCRERVSTACIHAIMCSHCVLIVFSAAFATARSLREMRGARMHAQNFYVRSRNIAQ